MQERQEGEVVAIGEWSVTRSVRTHVHYRHKLGDHYVDIHIALCPQDADPQNWEVSVEEFTELDMEASRALVEGMKSYKQWCSEHPEFVERRRQ